MATGLAAALSREMGVEWAEAAIAPSPLLVRLPPRLWTLLPASLALKQAALPPAGIVIGAGRRVAPLVRAVEASGRARGVQILDSGLPPGGFAAVVCPAHDGLAGENVIATLGSVNRITPEWLAAGRAAWADTFAPLPSPRIAVLLGGATKRASVSPERIAALAADLRALGGSLMITASRRTGAENIARLRAALPQAWFWDGQGDNPYAGMLAWADAVVVSDDSVNMMSEAASCPAPVAVWPLLGEGDKVADFRAALYAAGVAAPFDGRIPGRSADPLDETTRAARVLAGMLRPA